MTHKFGTSLRLLTTVVCVCVYHVCVCVQIIPDPTRIAGHYVETRVWPANGKCNGIRHKRGENMLTWQVIRDSSLSSYDILANPIYNVAAAAIATAAQQVRVCTCVAVTVCHRVCMTLCVCELVVCVCARAHC